MMDHGSSPSINGAIAADAPSRIELRLSQLEQGLTRSRREARAWRVAALAAVLLLAVSTQVGSQAAGGARSSERKAGLPFVVADERGRPLLRVRKGEYGGVLELLRANGTVQTTLACGDDGGEVTVSGRSGTPVGDLSSINGGSLRLRYPNGIQATILGNHATGPSMRMHDIHRTKVLALGTSGIDNRTLIRVFNQEGQECVSLDETPMGGRITCFTETLKRDQPTHPMARVESTGVGGKLSLFDRKGKPRLVSP